MWTPHLMRGQSLVEILFAIAIFTVGVFLIGYVVFDGFVSLRHGSAMMRAVLMAHQGIEAARSVGEHDFDAISSGTYGAELSGGHWTLIPGHDTDGIYTRTITVEDVDTETKKLDATVSWEASPSRANSVTITDYVTDWRGTKGEAGDLSIDASGAALTASGTELTGITIENTGSTGITLTGMLISWDAPGTLTTVTLSGVDIFSAATSSGLTSGSYANTTDEIIGAGAGPYTLDKLEWYGSVAGTDVLLTFIFEDGSRKHIRISP